MARRAFACCRWLQAEQREALQVALEAGYFDVPRNATLVELVEELDVSDSAVSRRLRRALSTLLDGTMQDETPSDPGQSTDRSDHRSGSRPPD